MRQSLETGFRCSDEEGRKGHTLKPNHPNQMRMVPRKTRVVLWGFAGDIMWLYLLFPRTKAYARAAHPEAIWTGPPPAKSREGSLNNHPLGFHSQQAMGQYTAVAQQKLNIRDGTMFPRSNEPMGLCSVSGFRCYLGDLTTSNDHDL